MMQHSRVQIISLLCRKKKKLVVRNIYLTYDWIKANSSFQFACFNCNL